MTTALTNEKPTGEVLTVPEVARYLKTSPSYVYRLCRQRKLAHFKLGKTPRIYQHDLDTYLHSMLVAVE